MLRSMLSDDRLEAIAGPPLAVLDGVGESSPLGPLGGFDDRILYAVVEVIDTTGHFLNIASLGTIATGRVSLRTEGAGSDRLGSRYDLAGGSTNRTMSFGGTRTTGRHIMWGQVREGMSIQEVGVDSVLGNIATIPNPGDGMATAPSLAAVNGSGHVALGAVAYRGAHDEHTRRRVLAWLARRYGVNGEGSLSLSLSLSHTHRAEDSHRADWALAC